MTDNVFNAEERKINKENPKGIDFINIFWTAFAFLDIWCIAIVG